MAEPNPITLTVDEPVEWKRLQFIFEALPIGISLTHEEPDGTVYRMINAAHLRICGLTREQVDDPENFRRISHPDDYEKQQRLRQRLEAGEIDHFSTEKRYVRPDGSIVWVVFTMQRRRFSDGSFDQLTTVADVTALKLAQEETQRAEARLKFIFDAAPVGLAWMVVGKIETRAVNSHYAEISGVPVEQCRDLRLYREATHPADRVRQDEFHRRLELGEIDHYVMEKRYVRADGSVRWALLTVKQLRSEDNTSRQEISALIDITDRKKAELELERVHRQMLETSHEAGRAEIATSVLHNVGNVLNSVNVSANLLINQVRNSKALNVARIAETFKARTNERLTDFLSQDPKTQKLPEYLAALGETLATENSNLSTELHHLQRHIEHIAEIVRMQQDYATPGAVIETVSIAETVNDALRITASAMTRHCVEVKYEENEEASITTDRHRLLQILVNLLENAKNACVESDRPEKRVVIRAQHEPERLTLRVIDNGVGISAENLGRIFAHGFTTRRTGHGFGLHSSALAAKAMGGSLLAESPGVGHGATFTLCIPRTGEPGSDAGPIDPTI